jgi:hypothetical protein
VCCGRDDRETAVPAVAIDGEIPLVEGEDRADVLTLGKVEQGGVGYAHGLIDARSPEDAWSGSGLEGHG